MRRDIDFLMTKKWLVDTADEMYDACNKQLDLINVSNFDWLVDTASKTYDTFSKQHFSQFADTFIKDADTRRGCLKPGIHV